ncbi:MAG: TetR/AcrR family transcriptional regulator [Deltaproteobacteria bacterium]|nr:TetR/AcrR family transcriptional regulator [Deltaproteobacteria bacterium]
MTIVSEHGHPQGDLRLGWFPLTIAILRVTVPPSMTKVTQRAKQKLDTRERIRAAAWELFTTDGYDETTTKAVAERAGVATGTVFVHARDKADLLALVLGDRIRDTVDEGFASLPRGGLIAQWMHLFGRLFRMYAEHPKLSGAFVRSVPASDKGPNGQALDAYTFAFLHRLGTLVASASQRGELRRDVPSDAAARNAFALYLFALTAMLGGYVPLDAALVSLRESLELQVRGLKKG